MSEQETFEAMVELGIALPVSDMPRALEFYCDFLGFEFAGESEPGGDGRHVSTVRYGNVLIDLVTEEQVDKRSNYRLFWTVDSLDYAVEHIQAGGGKVLRHMEYGIFCTDPDGNPFLVKVKEPEPGEIQELFF